MKRHLQLYLFFCRKNTISDDQQNTRHTEEGQSSEEPTDQRSVAAAEETKEFIPASSQELSGVEHLLQQERSPPTPMSRPLSPSHYMRRLPPPSGFYLSKEHSYAQLCPLLWRRRYNQAIDSLEKALRQLHAARRRENRLRNTVLRLRDKQLKQALLVSQAGYKNRGSWTPGVENTQGKGGCYREENKSAAKSEVTGVFEDGCVDQIEMGDHFLHNSNSWSDDEKGYCFYCGRSLVQVGHQVVCSVSNTGKDVQPTEHEDSLKIQISLETGTCSTDENFKDIKILRLERPPGKSVGTCVSGVTNSKVLFQTQGLKHVVPAGVSLTDIHEQSVQFLSSHQKLLLSDMCEWETEAMDHEHHLDLQQQQLFWIQDSAERQVILVPVPAEDGLQNIGNMEGVPDEAQTLLTSEMDLTRDMGHVSENSGLFRVETVFDGDNQHSVINTKSVKMGDVREKLKEHLEGFHLQLSTQFLN